MDTLNDPNLMKDILQKILNKCSTLDIEVDRNFCSYLINMLSLDPTWKIFGQNEEDEDNINAFVDFCCETLANRMNSALATLKMQHYFMKNVMDKRQMIGSIREHIEISLFPLYDDILSVSFTKVNTFYKQKLIKKIICYITLLSGMGNPSHTLVFKEALHALNSVFNERDLEEFIKMKKSEKEQQLIFLKSLVTGIRLFNSDCGKSSAEIEDLPRILSCAIQATQTELQKNLLRIMEKVNILTSAIEKCYSIKLNDNEFILSAKYNNLITEDFLVDAKNLLIMCRQHEVYVRKLLAEISLIEMNSKELFEKLSDVFAKIHNITKFRVAVPTSQIFPLFIDLSNIWYKIQNESILLSTHNDILQHLHEMVKDFVLPKSVKLVINQDPILTDAMRLEKTMGFRIKSVNKCKILESNRISDFERIPLQYLGFCAWTLVVANGSLIPGNPNMGILKWNNKCYVFSSVEAAKMFGLDPERYVNEAIKIARKNPELINLLQLYDDMVALRAIDELSIKPAELWVTKNVQVQTEMHPTVSNVDPNYHWNVWEIYRRAVKYANIEKCRSSSTQT